MNLEINLNTAVVLSGHTKINEVVPSINESLI